MIGVLTFVYDPATFPNTFTEIVQLALAESVPPLTVMPVVDGFAVIVAPVNVPTVQEVTTPLGVAINNPVGKVSEKPTPVNAVDALGLASVNRRTLLVP